ncbi:MAG: gliding motility-associated C-terminal domain-containing protein [Bacteroidota bacterium]
MKRTLTYLSALLLLLVVSTTADCQVQSGRKYRVIAYKKGDQTVQSVSNEITVIPSMTLYIPNTFTPNGDGMNDTFGITGEAIKQFTMQIYDRWGQLIFETADANHRWDGTFEGQKAMVGTYVYKITATGPLGGRQTKEGNFNLIM